MPSPRNYQTEAIVIRKTRLGEADRILTLYTPGLGKIRAVARGIRRPKAKLVGHLELLTHSQVSLVRGRNLDTITGSQAVDSFACLKTDLWATACGLYVAELVDQFSAERIENSPLFDLLRDTLHRLEEETGREVALRFFEMHLLGEAGYRPQLQECVACRRMLEPVVNFFCSGSGGMLCPTCRGYAAVHHITVNALKVLRLLQGDDYDTAVRLRIDGDLAREVETVLRLYIRYLLEREIKSVVWLDTLRAQGMAPAAAIYKP